MVSFNVLRCSVTCGNNDAALIGGHVGGSDVLVLQVTAVSDRGAALSSTGQLPVLPHAAFVRRVSVRTKHRGEELGQSQGGAVIHIWAESTTPAMLIKTIGLPNW